MKKLNCILLAIILCFCLVASVACNTHTCQHKCDICGKCTSDCADPACKDKCQGHNTHTCKHKCEICGKCTSDCTDPACSDKCQGHELPVYSIKEEFDDPAKDKENWDNGEVKGMHEVKNGHLILTHTGATEYPSKGRAMQVSIDKYPYLAIKVDELIGSNAVWSVKLQFAQDATSSRVLQNDTTSTGLLFYDLRNVDGMPQTGNVEFTLYIYILGQGSSVSVDYIRSAEVVPGTENFNEQGDITVSDGTLSFNNGVMTVAADQGKTAVVNVPLAFPSALSNMIDVFVSGVGADSTWSLACGDKTLIDETANYGAFGVDASKLSLDGKLTLKISVKGEAAFDQIAALQYDEYSEHFDYENDDALLNVWKEDVNNAYIEMSNGSMLLAKANDESQTAEVTTTVRTNVSVYPELKVVVSELTNAKLEVRFGGKKVGEITETGEHSFNLIENMLFGLRTDSLSLVLVSTSDESSATVSALIDEVSLVRNATFSKDAIAPKGERVDTEGGLNEQGNDYGNWIGDATVIARGGKLEFIQALGVGYSKGEVYAKNVDLSVNRYLNVKIDGLTSGAACKVEVIYNPQMAGEIVRTAITEGNNVGVFTVDLYKLFGLTDDNKLAEKVSYSIFIVGGVGSICTVDYITNNSEIDEAPVIVDVVPAANKTVASGEQVELSAALKLHSGEVTITVEKESVDVTETVLNGNVFSTTVEGVYTVTYSYLGAESVTRTITVESAEVPTISLVTEDKTVTVNESVNLQYTIANAPDGAKATISVLCGEQDVTSKVLNGEVFTAADTGVYVVSFQYAGATTQSVTLTVVSEWTSTDTNITISEKDGKLILWTERDYPKATRTFRDMVINDAPYLKISISAETNAMWNVKFGDINGERLTLIGNDTNQKGVFYLDLRRAPYEGKFDSKETITFDIFAIGNNAQVVVDCFEFVTEDEVPPVIVDVTPATDKTVSSGEQVTLGASLKPNKGNVVITVEKNGVDVTETVLNGNVFSTTVEGVYTVTYSYLGAESVTRTITVESAEVPTISVETESGNVEVNESVILQYTLTNAPEGAKATVTVLCGEEDVTEAVLKDGTFQAANTGEYVIGFAYEGATAKYITLTVVSKWTSTDSNIKITEKDGVLTLLAENNWPKAQKTFHDMVIDDAPYLKISIAEATDARYKIEFGDDFYNVKEVIKAEGGEKGVFYIDLRQAPYEGKTNQPQTITFYIYAVGTNQKVVVDCFEFITENQAREEGGIVESGDAAQS